MSLRALISLPLVLVAAAMLWMMHARAWDLGGRSPVLGFDTGQYAVAGRELAQRGVLATPFALPIELATHATPPWPLAVVQPGLVLVNAAILAIVPHQWAPGSQLRAWLTIIFPFTCFLMLAASLALAVRHLAARWWPEAPGWAVSGAGLTLGVAFALDPEAQHFAMGSFTELPFTLGLLFGLLGLALGVSSERPLVFGLLLGVTGLFRANMLWLAPLFALAAAWTAPDERRLRTAALVLAGFVLPLAPWWLYKWVQFGSPAWDLTRFVVFDSVAGLDWFALFHRTQSPELPSGAEAMRLLSAKAAGNLPQLLLALTLGPRGLWLGASIAWLLTRPPRPLAAAGLVALGAALLGVLAAATSFPWLRYLFPARILLEPIGVLALWALIWRAHALLGSSRVRVAACVLAALLTLGWGAWSTQRGLDEARVASQERGVPGWMTLARLSMLLGQRLAPGEVVMSNLGPSLAWQTRRPVIHLAYSPQDVSEVRARCEFRHIVLCFRTADRVWAAWREVWLREGAATATPGLGVIGEQRFETPEGFTVVWLELGPRTPTLALAQRQDR